MATPNLRSMLSLYVTPLWPAGHLPLKGGDQACSSHAAFPATLSIGEGRDDGSISPLAGEMAGRTEGGNVERRRWMPARKERPWMGALEIHFTVSFRADVTRIASPLTRHARSQALQAWAPLRAPLWPAGHLPRKGGDQLSCRPSLIGPRSLKSR